MNALLTRTILLIAIAMLLPAVWNRIKPPAKHQQVAVIQPLPQPTEADPWRDMSDAELVRGDAEAYSK